MALVPHSSPISQTGLIFQNTLFENAASHIAFAQSYSTAMIGGETMEAGALATRGCNSSLIHIDWMIGYGAMEVDGVRKDGSTEAVMRAGEWVTPV